MSHKFAFREEIPAEISKSTCAVPARQEEFL